MLALGLLVTGCAEHKQETALVSPTAPVALTDSVKTNTLKVVKAPGGAVETLKLDEAIIENEGTDREKKCLCQAVCFRAAQLAAQAWEDGIFRTYEVERIRTGWNTGGPWEFFSDKQMHGEIGDLEIPAKKIAVEKPDGSEANPKMRLTIEDNWYEFTLTNGRTLVVRVKRGEDGIFPAGFLALRNKVKSGDKSAMASFKSKYKEAMAAIGKTPFTGIAVRGVEAK
jgi:hypothetical protein